MNRLIIIDVSSFIFRSYYAISLLTTSKGVPVNATLGVINMLLNLFEKYQGDDVVITWDHPKPSFRKEMYSDYKANRDAPPEDLAPQFDQIRKLVTLMKIPQVQKEGFEADDLIGSIIKKNTEKYSKLVIVTSDKDLFQFVSDKVTVLDTKKNKEFGPNEVKDKMGVLPNQIIDYLSLLGDTSDNIPGVKGIGAKGAVKLLEEYGNLDKILDNVDSIKNKRMKTALSIGRDDAFLSKKLVTIDCDVDVSEVSQNMNFEFMPGSDFIDYLKDLEFSKVITKIEKMKTSSKSTKSSNSKVGKKVETETETEAKAEDFEKIKLDLFRKCKITTLETKDDLNSLCSKITSLEEPKIYVIHSLNRDDQRFHLFISIEGNDLFFLNCTTDSDYELYKDLMNFLWSDDKRKIISNDLKSDLHFLFSEKSHFHFNYFDIVQADYLLSGKTKFKLEDSYKRNEISLDNEILLDLDESVDPDLSHLVKNALMIEKLPQLYKVFIEKLSDENLEKVFFEIDNPFTAIMTKMENIGVEIDNAYFSQLKDHYELEINEIKKEIYKNSSEDVNLKSPKQVAELLFQNLKLPIIKKTKTGYSTDSEVLTTLDKMELSPVPGQILKFRELEKLLSTYVNTIPLLVNEVSGRIHTHFHQNSTMTGRLSSNNPNLQNIPVRSFEGKKIRKGFVAKNNHQFISADYSQVELRLLAHFSKDPTMLKALNEGRDVHTETAAELSGVQLENVTKEMRNMAKTVNYGLMYGQSSFGLSKVLGISRKEAQDYITLYFSKFSKVKSFLDSLREECIKDGFAKTMFGRKRNLPDIYSKNKAVKAQAERLAINTPIQGTAADIIKVSMLKIDKILSEKNLNSKLILQVHDELIFEVPDNEIDEMTCIIREGMEKIVSLEVPLIVDIGVGKNWMELK